MTLPQRGSRGCFAPFLPPAFMRGEGRAVAGGVSPPQRERPSQSRRSPRQLSQRGSRGRCAPFLPPAFMRGEGRTVAGGVSPPQRGRPSQSRRSPRQLSQRESQERFAPFLPPAFMRGEGHAVAGGVSPGADTKRQYLSLPLCPVQHVSDRSTGSRVGKTFFQKGVDKTGLLR